MIQEDQLKNEKMKICKECQIEKPLSDYYIRTAKEKKSYHSHCKICFGGKYNKVKNPSILGQSPKHTEIKRNCRLCNKEFITTTNPKFTKFHCSKECRYEIHSRLCALKIDIGITKAPPSRRGLY
jgi:hypothetical protein